jgi:hypothetical protein
LNSTHRAKLISHRQNGEFSLLESNTTTIAANVPAFNTVYTNTFPKTGEVLKTMEITTIITIIIIRVYLIDASGMVSPFVGCYLNLIIEIIYIC